MADVEQIESRYTRLRNAFRGLDEANDELAGATSMQANQRIGKARAANVAFLSQKFGLPTKDTARVYETLRADAAKFLYNASEDPGDEGLYNLIAGEFKRNDDVRVESQKVAEWAYNKALTTNFLESPEGEVTNIPWHTAYEQFKAQRGEVSVSDDKAEAVYRQVFRNVYEDSSIENQEVKELGNSLLKQLEIEEGVEAKNEIARVDPEIFDKLKLLSSDDRKAVYQFLNANVDEGRIPDDWTSNTSKAFSRGFINTWGHISLAGAENALDRVLNNEGDSLRVVVGEDFTKKSLYSLRTIEETNRGKFNQSYRKLTDEEVAKAREWAEELAVDTDVHRELRDVRQQVVNPVKTDSFLAAKAFYPALEQVGYMSLAASKWTAPLLVAATQDMRFEEMRNRGLSRSQAQDLSAISALLEYPVERLQFKTLTGRKFGGAIGAAQRNLRKKFGIGGRLVEQAAIQNLQEAVQDITPMVVQEVASKLSEEFPGVDWEEEMEGYKKGRVDTFWALLPMVVIGAGAATAKDFEDAKTTLSDVNRVEALGVDRSEAEAIVETAREDPEAASRMFAEAEKAEVNTEAFDDYNRQVAEMLNSPDRPSINPLDDGRVEVAFEDGTSTIAEDMSGATQVVSDFVNRRAEEARSAVQKLMDDFSNRGIAEFTLDQRADTLEDLVASDVITETQARQRIADLSAETGQDFSGSALSQFPVYAQNEAAFREGVFRNVVRVFNDKNPFAIVEDVSEGFAKQWIAAEPTKFKSWIREYQEATNDVLVPDVNNATPESLVEAWSSLATSYFAGNVQESTLPNIIKKLFQQLATYFKHVFDRAATLKDAIKDGKLSDEFQDRLAESVGLGLDGRQQVTQERTLRELMDELRNKGKAADVPFSQAIVPSQIQEALEEFFRPPEVRVEAFQRLLSRVREIDQRFERRVREAEGNARQLDRLEMVQAAAQLEAIISVLPVSERGRVKGFARLNSIATDTGRLSFFRDRLARIDKVLDDYIARETRDKLTRLVERTRPRRRSNGRVTSTLGPDIARFVQGIHDVMSLTAAQVDEQISAINLRVSEVGNFEEGPALYERMYILEKYGNLTGKDSESLTDALAELTTAIDNGRSAWKQQEEARKAVVDGLVDSASSELGVGPVDDADIAEAEVEERKALGKIASHTKGFLKEHLSFAQALANLFGYGRIKEHFENAVLKAKNANIDANLDRRKDQKRWAADVMGMNDPAFFAFIRDLKEVQEDSGVRLDNGRGMPLSQDEAIYFTMIAKQGTYFRNLEKQGIGTSTLQQMEEFLTPEAKQLRAYLAEQYDGEYDRINKVYQRINGVALPRVRHYAPVSVDLGKGDDLQLDPLNPLSVTSGLAAGFTKLRTNHALPIRRQGASTLYWAHAQQVDYYVSHAELVRQMQGVLLNRDLVRKLKVAHGSRAVDLMVGWVRSFHEAGSRQAGSVLAVDHLVNRIMKSTATIGLAYNIGTMMKQASALIGSFLDIPASAWIRGFSKFMFGRSEFSELLKDPIIQRRIQAGFSPEMQAAMSRAGATPGWLARKLETGLQLIGHVDAVFTSVSAAVAYDHHYREAGKVTQDPAQRREIALQQTDLTVSRTAQPIAFPDKSLAEVKMAANPMAKLLFMFRSEMRQKAAITFMGLSDVIKGRNKKQAAQAAIGAWIFMPLITAVMNEFHAAMFRDPEEEDEWQPETFINAMIAGQSSGLFLVGDVISAVSAIATGKDVFTNADNTLADSTIKLFRSANKIADGDFGEEDLMKDINNLARSMGMLVGGPIGSAVGVIGRTGRDVTGAFEHLQEIGDTPSALELELKRLKEVDDALKKARKERREAKPKEEADELPPTLAAIKKLGVNTGARALGIKALIAATPEEGREDLMKQLEDAKLLSKTVKRQLKNL